jgi:hypothetical protein
MVLLDLKHQIRWLARSPGFALAALGTLALGIGVTTAIFAVFYGVLLRPLPFPDPDRIAFITRSGDVSIPDGVDWRARSRSWKSIGLFARAWNFDLTGLGDPEPVTAHAIEPEFLSDIRTAVTEACNNVVIHAFQSPEEDGLLEVEADANDGTRVDVVVRDYGAGLQPNTVPPGERSLGLGLPLIAALSRRYEIRGGTGGLEVKMIFAPANEAGAAVAERLRPQPSEDDPEAPRAAGMSIVPGPLVSAISGRVTAMLAARADFPLDRVTQILDIPVGTSTPDFITRCASCGRHSMRRERAQRQSPPGAPAA